MAQDSPRRPRKILSCQNWRTYKARRLFSKSIYA